MGYWLDDQGLIPGRGKRLSLLHNVHAGSKADTTSHPNGSGVSLSGDKAAGM
jgi:hypothetical protein